MSWKSGLKVSLALLAVGVLYLSGVSVLVFYGACTAGDGDNSGGLDIPLTGGPPCTLSGLFAAFVLLFILPFTAFWWQILLALATPVIVGAWIDLYRQKF